MIARRTLGSKAILLVIFAAVLPALAQDKTVRDSPSQFALPNGLQVIVIPDRRIPIVTHMIFYRVGAGDDPWGKSGIAHLLEHLMFKSTDKLASGEFSRIITRIGGRDNAYTTHDVTYYFQRVAKQHLARVMELEADRMSHLRLDENEVLVERDVVREERRSTIESNPLVVLSEQMAAALYLNHPYGRAAIGWPQEIEALSRSDALQFYQRHYGPDNAVLVVAGDVSEAEVRKLASETYGRNKPTGRDGKRKRPQEPAAVAARRIDLRDERAANDSLIRFYAAPSAVTATPGEAEAIEALTHILGGDDQSRLYRRLVETNLATTAAVSYLANGLDGGRISLIVIPSPDASISACEAAIDDILDDIRKTGVTALELTDAKSALETRRIFEADNKMLLARKYGEAVAHGRTLNEIEGDATRLRALQTEDLSRAARNLFSSERSVTGTLIRRRPEIAGHDK